MRKVTRMQAAWAGWYRLNAQAFDAMADRLMDQGEMTLALEARNEWRRQEALAEQIETLDNSLAV